MQTQEINRILSEIGQKLKETQQLSHQLERLIPADYPSLGAQASVMKTFLHQVHTQQEGILAMLKAYQQDTHA
ncbi:MAG: hypothetical protein SF053_13830 [Bacteroidia bacterium]|jgi:hypothetical protein|nr:hypothetical protein [Bacteroidia bacterium]